MLSIFGPFKILADRIGRKYTEFWISNTVLSSKEVLRMGEVNLVADLLIAMIEGIRPKNNKVGLQDLRISLNTAVRNWKKNLIRS